MAAELALGALGPAIEIVKWVSKPILRQCNYLCCFTTNISSLEVEAKHLDDALVGLEREVEEGRDNVLDPVPEVETWITDSKKIKDKISGILNEATNVGSVCSKLGQCYCLSRRAKKTTESTKEHLDRKPQVKFLPRPKAAAQGVQLEKAFEWESRNKIEEEIMTTLRGADVNMIGMCGMGGIGKTTMAKKLMNRALEENVFEEVVMAVVSRNVDKSKIQDEISVSLRLKLEDEKTESARVKKLHGRLNDTTRTLLVLDDVWEKLALESIGIPRNSEWCKILFTSRNRDALHVKDVQIFRMEVLSKDEAWSFFREEAGTCVDDRKLKPIAEKVAEECGGLPINLAIVGAGLNDERDAAIWNDTLRKLEESVPDNVQYDKESYTPLKWSYDSLNSKEAQSLFLLCCVFPEDADIPLEYLTNFCMGLRIFEKGITAMEAARNNMRALTKLLKDRSLLLDSDYENHVRMHDVVRDVGIFIAKDEGYIGREGCTWISSSHLLRERNEILSGSRCPNLRLLFLDGRYDGSLGFNFDDAFLEAIGELHVLCIENYSLRRVPHPKQPLETPYTLNTLILVSCNKLKTIFVVGELVNLEILICRDCNLIEELPSKMRKLNRLKVLELTKCGNLQHIERAIISSLVTLEELKILDSFNRWEERENAQLRELEDLPNLSCLEIDILNRFGTPLGEWIQMKFLRNTEYLYLSVDGANNVAGSQKIRWLELRRCKSMNNVARTSVGDDATVFPLIERLELEYLPQLQEIMHDGPVSSNSFHNLNNLKLTSLRALTQIWKSNCVCRNNFTNLSSIDISHCDSLRNLGQLSMAGKDCLPQLEKLEIWNCEMMEQVFLWNNKDADDNKTSIESQRSHHVITKVFPKLEEVKLYSLPNLTTLYQGIQGIEFPLLRVMKIEECPKMKSIIESCSPDIDCQPQKVSFGGSLEILEINHDPFRGHKIPSSLCNRLEELTISKCEGRMSLFTLSMGANLASLRQLYISECDEMIKVIEDEEQQERILVFPKLEKFVLKELPKLVTFCDSKCQVECPLLTKVEIYGCPSMTNMSLGSIAIPNLEAFRTDLSCYVGVGIDVSFDSVKELEITWNAIPLYDDKISISLFNGLEKLKFIEYNFSSMSVFSSSAVGNLMNLRVLHIQECYQIVKVIEDEEETEDGKVVVSGGEIRTVIFPKLEELYLYDLPELVKFSEWKREVELPSLTKVEIKDCPNLENFSLGLVEAPTLKRITINGEYTAYEAKELNGEVQQYLAKKRRDHGERRTHDLQLI